MRTFFDQLPKRGKSNEQQRHEHGKYIESILVRETTLHVMPIDTDPFEIEFLVLKVHRRVMENVYISKDIDVQSCTRCLCF